MEQDLVRRIVEAALFASPQPLSLVQLAGLFPEDAPAPADSIERALGALREESPQRGVELVEVASGFRFQVRAEVHGWVSRLWAERQTRYSRALLETLALIAYRQPITRGEIEQIRGVAVSSNIIRTMEERDWIRVVGHRDVPGRPALFGTTRGFLDYFGLRSLDQLPPLTELHDLPDLAPELPLEPAVARADSQHTGHDLAMTPSEPLQGSIAAGGEGEGDEPLGDEDDLAGERRSPHDGHPHHPDQPFDASVDPAADDAEPDAADDVAAVSPPDSERLGNRPAPSSTDHPSSAAGAAGDTDEPQHGAESAPSEQTQ